MHNDKIVITMNPSALFIVKCKRERESKTLNQNQNDKYGVRGSLES